MGPCHGILLDHAWWMGPLPGHIRPCIMDGPMLGYIIRPCMMDGPMGILPGRVHETDPWAIHLANIHLPVDIITKLKCVPLIASWGIILTTTHPDLGQNQVLLCWHGSVVGDTRDLGYVKTLFLMLLTPTIWLTASMSFGPWLESGAMILVRNC